MSIQPYLDTYLTRHGVSLDTSSDRELMYALTAAVRDLCLLYTSPSPRDRG